FAAVAAVERADAHARALGYRGDRRVRISGEHRARRVEHELIVARRLRASAAQRRTLGSLHLSPPPTKSLGTYRNELFHSVTVYAILLERNTSFRCKYSVKTGASTWPKTKRCRVRTCRVPPP